MSEKTEEPTPKKLRDARQKGQVAQSKDATSTALLLALFALFVVGWRWMFHSLRDLMLLPAEVMNEPFDEALGAVVAGTVATLIKLSLPLLGIVLVVGIAVNFFQVGPLFVLEPIKPDLKKLNPADKAKQIFSMKNLIEFIKSVLKVTFLGILLYLVIKGTIPAMMDLPHGGLPAAVAMLEAIMYRVAIYTGFAYTAIAAADYAFQRWQFTKQLRMSKDEVKREYKEMEGDPHIKSKRKHLHQELIMSDRVERVRTSTVLVTNPTHRAIAIYYKEGETKLPVITAMGEGILARRMIEVAQQEGIPIMQNVPLAHDLFDQGQIEQYIPAELIEPIAEILRWVRDLQGA